MWPFVDEQTFWAWAADPDAELADQDEDLLLRDPAGLPLLLAAAADPSCPKREYCGFVVEDYARWIVGWDRTDVYPALRAAVATATDSTAPPVRHWAEYVTRLFSYREQRRTINRAEAETMASDLLHGPALAKRLVALGQTDVIVVQVAPNGKHWHCAEPGPYPTLLVIDRRTGDFRLTKAGL